IVTANADDPAKTSVAATAAPPSHFISCILSSHDDHALGASAVGRMFDWRWPLCIRPADRQLSYDRTYPWGGQRAKGRLASARRRAIRSHHPMVAISGRSGLSRAAR